MTRVSASDLYDGVAAAKQPDHDTLYCSPEHQNKLLEEAAQGTMSMYSSSKENIKIAGLNVITFPQIERPIVCQKGEVFPLAADHKE